MHRMKPLQGILPTILLCIGIFPFTLNAADADPDFDKLEREHKVYVEPDHLIVSETTGAYELEPYAKRRPNWGTTVALEYNSYEPIKYEPSFANAGYTDVYRTPDQPLMEIIITEKRNLSFGSVGLEFGGGLFKNSNTPQDPTTHIAPLGNSTLSLTVLRMGVVYNMDMLFKSPTVVPYISGGGYLILYKESLGGNSFNGNTQPAPYANFGVAFQLDWLDRDSATEGYRQSGTENSFIFVEGRTLVASSVKKDPNFNSDVNWAAGFKIEF